MSSQEGTLAGLAGKFGLGEGLVVQELGFDVDCDQSVSDAIASVSELVDETYDDVVDAVLLWWRDGDGDLVDELMDALTYLSETGPIWVLTPKVGRDGHVEPSDIQDAAPIAGMSQTSTLVVANDWTATRLVARKAGKR